VVIGQEGPSKLTHFMSSLIDLRSITMNRASIERVTSWKPFIEIGRRVSFEVHIYPMHPCSWEPRREVRIESLQSSLWIEIGSTVGE
jgi:hypothetical protein